MPKSLLFRVVIVFSAMAAISATPREGEAARQLEKLRKARVEAARHCYNVALQNNREGSVELPYRWSCRVLEAERQLTPDRAQRSAALTAHLERMREVSRVAHERFRQRITTVDQTKAAEFYRTEAEIWLAEAGE